MYGTPKTTLWNVLDLHDKNSNLVQFQKNMFIHTLARKVYCKMLLEK